jgi:hypothetical protein
MPASTVLKRPASSKAVKAWREAAGIAEGAAAGLL